MHAISRTAALAAAALTVVSLAACSATPEPTPMATSSPEPTAQASPSAGDDTIGLWEGLTSHCGTVGQLMQVDPSVDPQVNGYAPADLRDSGTREAASGDVEIRSDGSPYIYTVADGDQMIPIARRFCAPDPDYVAWLNGADDADGVSLRPGDRLWLVPNEPA